MISADELTRLWHVHAAALVLICRVRCNGPEDCVQEAFIRLASQSPVPDDPVAWLARVARNAAITQHRSDTRRRRREQRAARDRPPWFEPVTNVAPFDDTASVIQVGLQQMEQTNREIVIAHVWGGMTFRQIGMAFGISRTSAHRKYNAGLESLKTCLSPTGGDDPTTKNN